MTDLSMFEQKTKIWPAHSYAMSTLDATHGWLTIVFDVDADTGAKSIVDLFDGVDRGWCTPDCFDHLLLPSWEHYEVEEVVRLDVEIPDVEIHGFPTYENRPEVAKIIGWDRFPEQWVGSSESSTHVTHNYLTGKFHFHTLGQE